MNRDSVVGIATGYGLDNQGFEVRVQTGSGAHPRSYSKGTGGGLSLEVKRSGREADRSPPASAEFEKI
jgi:hypothetical protein